MKLQTKGVKNYMRSITYEKSVSIYKHTRMADVAWKQHGHMIISKIWCNLLSFLFQVFCHQKR